MNGKNSMAEQSTAAARAREYLDKIIKLMARMGESAKVPEDRYQSALADTEAVFRQFEKQAAEQTVRRSPRRRRRVD